MSRLVRWANSSADNACIYKDLLPIHAFGRNPHVYPITAAQLQVAAAETPAYLQYGMVCMTLSHRLNTTRGGPQTKALAERFYMYWGLAVRSLNEHLSLEDRRTGDKVFAGILTLLLVDVSYAVYQVLEPQVNMDAAE